MVPPEQVFVTTTTMNPTTNTPLRVIPVMVSPVTVAPVTVTTGTQATLTQATAAPVTVTAITDKPVTTVTDTSIEKCTTCVISTIAPTSMATGTSFSSTETGAPGACVKTIAMCKRDDIEVCTDIKIITITSTGSVVLATSTGTNVREVSANLTCETDSLYSNDITTSRIGQLSCEYTCTNPCTTCNINAIKPTLLPTGASFQSKDTTAAGGCVEVSSVCQRDDTQICTGIVLTATTPNGPVVLTNAMGTMVAQAAAALICQSDGTFTSGMATGINSLTCDYTCKPPPSCTSCDINTIAPILPSGFSYTTFEFQSAPNCVQTQVRCIRDSGVRCAVISTSIIYDGGTRSLGQSFNQVSSGNVYNCEADGRLSYGGFLLGITRIICDFQC